MISWAIPVVHNINRIDQQKRRVCFYFTPVDGARGAVMEAVMAAVVCCPKGDR